MVLLVASSLGFGAWTALAAVVTTTDRPLPGSQARLWTNSQGARIPCRTTGDSLISFEPHGNGASVGGRRITDHADPATGCATHGSLVSASNLTPGVDVQGSFNNDSAIHNYLPGFYAATIPDLNFGEAAINLSKVLSDLRGRE